MNNTMTEEERKALLEERRDVREAIHAFQPLITSGGWRKLTTIVDSLIKQREMEALYGDGSSQEKARAAAEAGGMRMLMQLPEMFLGQRDILEKLEGEE